MARKTITISLPAATQAYVFGQVELAGYGSVSEYFRELVRADRQRQINRAQRAKELAEQEAFAARQSLASAARRYR